MLFTFVPNTKQPIHVRVASNVDVNVDVRALVSLSVERSTVPYARFDQIKSEFKLSWVHFQIIQKKLNCV